MALAVSLTKSVDIIHSDIVNDSQIDFYGRRLATGSSDSNINIYDITKDESTLISTLEGHEGPVWQVAWSDPSQGCYLASCSHDKKLIIWKENSSQWKKDYVHVTHLSSSKKSCLYFVTSICWAPIEHGLILACASYDGTISIVSLDSKSKWEYNTIMDVDKVGVITVCWGPPFWYPSENKPELVRQIAAGGVEGLVKIYHFNDKKWVQTELLCGEQGPTRSISWTTTNFGAINYIATAYHNGYVLVWSKGETDENKWQPLLLKQFPKTVWHVSWSEIGNVLAISYGDNEISIWKRSLENKWACIKELNQSS